MADRIPKGFTFDGEVSGALTTAVTTQGDNAETAGTRADAAADRVEASEDDARAHAQNTASFVSIVDGLTYDKGAKGWSQDSEASSDAAATSEANAAASEALATARATALSAGAADYICHTQAEVDALSPTDGETLHRTDTGLLYLRASSAWVAKEQLALVGCSTVAALRGRDGVDGSWAQVRDSASAGDLGPRFYYYDTTSTATDDGIGIVKPTSVDVADPGRWLLASGVLAQRSDWTSGGGRNLVGNPEASFVASDVDTVVCFGGRNSNYENNIGTVDGIGTTSPADLNGTRTGSGADLSGILSGGDNTNNQLAGVICGGAHHHLRDAGSHGFAGGGSYNDLSSDYGVVVGGTLNEMHALKAAIVGGQDNRIGTDGGDQTTARNSFIGAGYLNTIDGQYAAIPSGQLCKAQKDYTTSQGYGAVTNYRGEAAQGSFNFSAPGDAQTSVLTVGRETTTGTATNLLSDGSSLTSIIGSNTTLMVVAHVVATRTDVAGSEAAYIVQGCISNRSGTLSVKSQSTTVVHEDVAGWNADLQASGTTWYVRGQGSASQTVRWVARVEITTVRVL